MNRPRLILAPGKEKALLRRHPWIFSGALLASPLRHGSPLRPANGTSSSGARREDLCVASPSDGDLVDVFSSDGRWLAVGHYQNDTIICKVLSFDTPVIDDAFFFSRIRSAIAYRQRLGFFDSLKHSSIQALKQSTNVFRLINGEGDNLPGLICDWYAGTLVMQAHSVGMHHLFPSLVGHFVDLLKPYGLLSIYDKSSATLPGGCENSFLWGEQLEEREVCENGNRMMINFVEGQKTGFFVDQRDNRQLVGSLSSGCRVLNCFGYTGGFSLAALRGGATYVETVDISKRAIELCNRNVELNFGPDASHRGVVADVLKYLDAPVDPFDVIILDPPAFAKNHRSLQQGLKGYRSINQRAMERIAPGGLLFTFSCSQAVSPDDFQTMIFTSAANAHRFVRIVRHLPHAADHPVSIYHPEGLYLKGLLLQVE